MFALNFICSKQITESNANQYRPVLSSQYIRTLRIGILGHFETPLCQDSCPVD
uniref:Uncharacterized protein n=1 Tax=Candidatus Kentrum sp. TUN TaxID=2126343 RepID=A0A450ZGR7_9GAMM|nr:MAG: hypothetical protein BECKTUN1418F_GA0071002_101532 [Candidatus Kentron sp. TUN]VFK53523.1 MAG: hypothetical protein BECKTUN1418E_GA0071001_101733 [Candidatus Kentron sp. TUN]